MRGRELPVERILFVVVLGCSVLLLSVVMLRSEQASASASTRVFRDGFVVAEQSSVIERRVETRNTTMAIEGQGTGPQVQVEHQGDHTMTKIKTEDGDEITIKRAANSKKITKISAHEDGKITIENHDKETTEPKADPLKDVARRPEELNDSDGKVIDVLPPQDDETKRGGYEKIAPGREAAAPAPGPAVDSPTDMEPRRIDTEPEGAKNKKVTIVELGDAHAKVSVEDAEALTSQ